MRHPCHGRRGARIRRGRRGVRLDGGRGRPVAGVLARGPHPLLRVVRGHGGRGDAGRARAVRPRVGRPQVKLEVRFAAVPVEGMRAFLEPLGYRFEWGPELEGIGFHWRKLPLSGTGVRATYFPDGGEGLLLIETDGQASPADVAMQDVTARLLAERFERASVWCATTGRAEYGGGQPAEPPAPGADPPAWYS